MFRRRKKLIIRSGLFAVNFALLGLAVHFVVTSDSANQMLNPQVALLTTQPDGAKQSVSSPLDQLSSTEIAVHVARMTQIESAIAVTNQADSVTSRSAVVSNDEVAISKPQIVSTESVSKSDIETYVVKDGDTVASLASRFGVSSDSIRWSNDLQTWSTLRTGQELYIPPTDGIVYIVKSGDTPESLADRYRANEAKLIAFNDAEIDGLVVGDTILIPNGQQPARSTAARGGGGGATFSSFAYSGTASFGGYNGYVIGYCTWHAANRRAQSGRPLPNNLGHARTWAPNAQRFGMGVSETPAVGAVMWHKDTSIAWGLGHVAYVERINSDGSAVVSEMNWRGWNVVSERTITPAEFGAYLFIN